MDTFINPEGYEVLTKYNRFGKYIRLHIVLAEMVLGRPLPLNAVVHHANGIKNDNRLANLVICPDKNYHNMLHRRMKAKKECGNPSWRKCGYCHKYESPKNLFRPLYHVANYHRECKARYESLRMAAKNGNKSKYHNE